MDLSFFRELSKFNNISFYDKAHCYFIDDLQVISVTGLIHRFEQPFDSDYWIDVKAKQRMKDQTVPRFETESLEDYLERAKAVIKAEWSYKNKHAIAEGSTLHTFIENRMSNKIVEESVSGDILYEEIRDTYLVMKHQANRFYDDFIKTGILIPVKSEMVIGSKELKIAGMLDQLFFDTRTNSLVIYDWKTNSKLRTYNEYGTKMLHCLSHLDQCELNTYSIQLKTYKHIIESSTNIRLAKECNIVWFNENNDSFTMFKCHDYEDEVREMFEFKNNNLDLFKVIPYDRPIEQNIKRATPMSDLLKF